MKEKSYTFAADFETTTLADDCRVWVWGKTEIFGQEEFQYGDTIDDFIENISQYNSVTYFHNLKFDGHFILHWLLTHGYTHTEERVPKKGEFTSLISDMRIFYTIKVKWKTGKTTEFRDSHKKIPLSISRIADTFQLQDSKGVIDCEAPRPIGYQPTPEEIDYLRRDVMILSDAMRLVLPSTWPLEKRSHHSQHHEFE